MTPLEQIETQAETIKRLWVENERLRQRVEKQQGMIDWFRKQIAPPTAEEVAEQFFKKAE